MKELERDMRALYVMFNDLHELVVSQGENVTEVATKVDSAANNLQKGQQQLLRAKELQKG